MRSVGVSSKLKKCVKPLDKVRYNFWAKVASNEEKTLMLRLRAIRGISSSSIKGKEKVLNQLTYSPNKLVRNAAVRALRNLKGVRD